MSARKSNRRYSIRGAATRRRQKKGAPKDAGGNKQLHKAAKYVSYCPHCNRDHVDPEGDQKVFVSKGKKGKVLKMSEGQDTPAVSGGGSNYWLTIIMLAVLIVTFGWGMHWRNQAKSIEAAYIEQSSTLSETESITQGALQKALSLKEERDTCRDQLKENGIEGSEGLPEQNSTPLLSPGSLVNRANSAHNLLRNMSVMQVYLR